jgi:release factor glutamine methyltransferase
MTWRALHQWISAQFEELSEGEAIAEALISVFYSVPRFKWVLDPLSGPDEITKKKLIEMTQRVQKGEPLQYVTGRQYFAGMPLFVSPGVLIPRPETEELLFLALQLKKDPEYILDFCTGSGCLALGLQSQRPHAKIIATDVSPAALEIAEKNKNLFFKDKQAPEFILHNLLEEGPEKIGIMADLIVSNPPYIAPSEAASMRPNVLAHEPAIALFAPESHPTVFYERLLLFAASCLQPQGLMVCELNPQFAAYLTAYATERGFCAEIKKDMSGKDRFWVVSKKA